jgi:hypothetical protein
VAYSYNPCTWEAEVGRLSVPGQPGLHSKTCLKKREGRQGEGGEKKEGRKETHIVNLTFI